jgi:cell division protein FtsW
MPRTVQPDRKLFGVTIALCLVGALMVFSSSAITLREQGGSGYGFLIRQLLCMALGIAGMFMLMNFDYRRLRQPRVIFTGLGVVLLLLVGVFFLDRSHATHRWFRIGPASFQPSEFAKLVVIVYLAWFLELRTSAHAFGQRLRVRASTLRQKIQSVAPFHMGSYGINDPLHSLLPALGPVLVMAGLILLEPDMGTSAMIFFIALVMLFVAGLDLRYLLGGALVAAPIVYLLIVRVPYRYHRLMAFRAPDGDPQGYGYQLIQSIIAVGSGGLSGVGLMESKQKLFYLPEAHTDFIFAVIAEELGYIGAVAVLALFAFWGWRAFRAAIQAPDEFGRLIGLGVTTLVVGQALVNLSVVLGLVPTKGIPLPFISYGGSSLLTMLLATGVLLNISQHAQPEE